MRYLLTAKLLFILSISITFRSELFSQSISGSTTICPGTGTVRYTFSPSTCASIIWGNVQGGPVTVVGGGGTQNYIDLQFPTVAADITYVINAGYNCGGPNGNASLSVLVKKGPDTETRTKVVPCSYSGGVTFDVDIKSDSWQAIQWSSNTGWQAANEWTDYGSNIDISHKNYVVNNLNGGYVKAVVLGLVCNNAPIFELTYNVARTSDLPAPAFTATSAAGICGNTSGAVSVSPPGPTPGSYRWYSVPANALKINGSFYSSASAPLTTTTPSVTIQDGTTSDASATLYVSAVYPGGCSTAWASRQIDIDAGIPSAPTVTSSLLSGPGEPTEYRFTATPMANVVYDWYLSGGTLVQSSFGNTYEEYFPCLVSRTYYCIARNSCGSSAPSNSVTRTGGCRDRDRVSNFTISPNPANNIVTITAKSTGIAKSEEQSVVNAFSEINIFDFNGNLVKRRQYTGVRQGTIDVGDLKTGTYYIEIKKGQYAEKQILIIQK